ncbi:MAG: hypothetical protein ACI4OS_06920 [Akkermansia sp.]
MRAALPALLLAMLALPAAAGFRSTEQRTALRHGQQRATIVFETGDGSTITRAKPLCDCLKLTPQGSRLLVEADTSLFDAPIDKQMDVRTSDGKTTRLTIHFEVPLAVQLSSRSLVWARGSAPQTQELRITLPPGSPVTAVLEAGLNGSDFDYSTGTLRRGREYRVLITPKTTARKCLNRLVLTFASSDPRFRQQIVYLQVR